MGQKTNPVIFRAGIGNYEWDSVYEPNSREESNFLLVLDLKIKNFLNRIFKINGFIMCYCKTQYSEKELCITVSCLNINFKKCLEQKLALKKLIVLQLNSSLQQLRCPIIKFNFKNLNINKQNYEEIASLKKSLRKFSSNPLLETLLETTLLSISEKNGAKLLADLLALELKNIREQNRVFFILKNILLNLIEIKSINVKGIKIVMNGRFGKAPRARKRVLTVGNVPLQTITSNISYSQSICYTANGTIGINVFICKNR